MTLEPVEALKRRIAELESFQLNYDHAMKIERHDFKQEISALRIKLDMTRTFIGSFTKYHEEMCSTFLDDAPEDECDCAKGAATKLLAQLDKTQDERDQLTADYESILVDHNKLLAEHVAMGAENMKLAANLKVTRGWSAKLVDFLSEGLEAAWDGCDWDGSDIQDKAEELGLIKSEPYDPKKHGEITCLPVERDTVTFYTICEEVLQLKELGTPDTDHCPSCGEYLHDEMGHMCPPHSDAPEERDRAVRTDHEYDQNPFYTGPGCAVCGLPTEAHAEGAKKLEERDRAVREEVIRVLVEADTNCEMYAAIECIRREFGLEG